MKLFSVTQGRGADVVLLHGWALHSGVWNEIADTLAQYFRVTLIDLPGHGRSPIFPDAYSLSNLATHVLDVAPPKAVWLGWSLGGMVAMQAALEQPERLAGLVLVASSPRFVEAADWPHAVPVQVLQDFAQDLQRDFRGTIRRFLALQMRGNTHTRDYLRILNTRAFKHGEPSLVALQAGLSLLAETDLRKQLKDITCPTLLVMGENDTLIPLAAAEALVVMFKAAYSEVIPGAGHAPFLSHPQQFLQRVTAFLHETLHRNQRAGQTSA